MEAMMNQEKFTFELVDKYTPDIVIKNLLGQIEEATRGYVIGNIEKYDGPILSYTKKRESKGVFTALQGTEENIRVDIQTKLGEQGSGQNKFEVFLTVKGLEYYRYRMMFVGYSAIAYPATVVMNEELAIAYSGKRNTVLTVDTMKKLEELIEDVINCEMMTSLLQHLINESLRQEIKNIPEYIRTES